MATTARDLPAFMLWLTPQTADVLDRYAAPVSPRNSSWAELHRRLEDARAKRDRIEHLTRLLAPYTVR